EGTGIRFEIHPLILEGAITMSMGKTFSSVALAAAAAMIFASAPLATASADDAKVKCEGANACKGQSACKSAKNSCKGQNACRGQGYTELSKADCDKAKAKK